MDSSEIPTEDVIKIMVATDIHLGYLENDPIRGDDSFIAFEEVLAAAKEADVDLVLLGGDLFHAAKPSPRALLRATALLRQYCLGDKPVALELLSDQHELFARCVNYEDPDLNVAYPVLSIHGNHDDPSGQDAVSSLDILSTMGLVNYFGKWSDYTRVRVAPVLLRKGATRLALYGLGHLKDRRLAKLFKESKVEMERPDDSEQWFNLLVLHQNRADRGPGNYIQEDVLPDFLDLVVWGHEHDCRVHEEENVNRRFFVTQPGSTVATSLASGESLPKHCALVQIHKKKFILTPVPLKTVRPFIFKTIVLSEEDLGEPSANENEKVQEFLKGKVYEAIEEARNLKSGHPKQPELPLVRLSVFYEREGQDFNRRRFCQNFNGAVANANDTHDDILIMKREKRIREKKESEDLGDEMCVPRAADAADVESLLHAYFAALPAERRLTVLSVRAMTDAVRDFTLKNDDDIFRAVLDKHRNRCLALLRAAAPDDKDAPGAEPDVEERLREIKADLDAAPPERLRQMLDEHPPPPKAAPAPSAAAAAAAAAMGKRAVVVLTKSPVTPAAGKRTVVVLSSDEDEAPLRSRAAPEPRGRGRGRARGRGRGRGATAPSPPPEPERRSTPRRNAARKGASWLQNIISDRGGAGDESD